jgi:cobalt-zinc-cadmium efflux system protein
MEHAHHHIHGDIGSGKSRTRLVIALFITAGYMIIEAVGGYLFNSLALLADSGHMLSDVMALGLSWLALQIGQRSPTDRHTFGFKRTEILAALMNGVALWAIVALLFYEAARRFFHPPQVEGIGMLIVAGVGLAVNLLIAALLFQDRRENLNIRSAFIHVIADALGSGGAIVAALIILATGLNWVDPLVSVLIGFLILFSSWELLKESVHILMEGVPAGLQIGDIEQTLLEQNGVCCVYDLHVWSITSNRHALSAHIVLSDLTEDRNEVLKQLNTVLVEKFHIDHTTIQIETSHEMRHEAEGMACRPGTSCTVFH